VGGYTGRLSLGRVQNYTRPKNRQGKGHAKFREKIVTPLSSPACTWSKGTRLDQRTEGKAKKVGKVMFILKKKSGVHKKLNHCLRHRISGWRQRPIKGRVGVTTRGVWEGSHHSSAG